MISFSNYALAECDFKTGNYIYELNDPSSIKELKIRTPKISIFYKNLFQIFSSKTKNISPKLRKKFNAKLNVIYKFGSCQFDATIRPSGDWKDHIKLLEGGKIISSLDIKLKNGNILNAVRFKLFLPRTRNGKNEILGSLIIRKAGFIAPETFEVSTNINGVRHIMTFQEKAAKEMLERNHRREGPIFEGDESLLWSYENYKTFELDWLSLSRLVNDKWFNKGNISEKIILESYKKLQNSYLRKYNYKLLPNGTNDNIFTNYHYVILATSGIHALKPHTRKFYYNTIDSKFEPIYYDGSINYVNDLKNNLDGMDNLFPILPEKSFINYLSSINFKEGLYEDFSKRIIHSNLTQQDSMVYFEDIPTYFSKSYDQFINNQIALKSFLKTYDRNSSEKTSEFNNIKSYISFQNEKKLNQKIITDIIYKNDNYLLKLQNDNDTYIDKTDLVDILSSNKLKNNRVVYIPNNNNEQYNDLIKIKLKDNKINLNTSKNMEVNVDYDNRNIYFYQNNHEDWALFKNSDLSYWNLYFNGISLSNTDTKLSNQRFNEYGLTGCLTLYKTKIDNTSFFINDGECEDSINLISAEGNNISVSIENAFSDSLAQSKLLRSGFWLLVASLCFGLTASLVVTFSTNLILPALRNRCPAVPRVSSTS